MRIAILSGVPYDYGGGGNRPNHLYHEFHRQNHYVEYLTFGESQKLFDQQWDIIILEYPYSPVIKDLSKLNCPTLIYDIIDDWGAMGGTLYNKEAEKELIDKADIVIAVSKKLIEMHPKAHYVPNAVEFNRFNTNGKMIPGDGTIKIGYIGNLTGHWIDRQLIYELAEAISNHPNNYQIHLVGKPPSAPVAGWNIIWHGELSYSLMPAYINSFDICIIPFKQCPLIDSTSPLKLFEYAALGKPIVSMFSKEHYDCPMLVANNHEEFIDMILNINNYDLNKEKIIEFAKNNTWEHRVNTIMELYNGNEYIFNGMEDRRPSKIRRNGIWVKCKFVACSEATNLLRGFAFEILGEHDKLIEVHGLDTERIDAMVNQLLVLRKEVAEYEAATQEEQESYWVDS